MIVVDSSVVTQWLLGRSGVAEAIEAAGVNTVHSTGIIGIETLSALKGIERRAEASAAQIQCAVANLLVAPITRHTHEPLLPLIWSLRHNSSVYDAAYLALSKVLDADQLWTLDRGQAIAATSYLGADRVRLFASS